MSGDSIRVLLVDDHSVVREGLRRLLEGEEGLHVAATAGNTAQALDALETEEIDLALVDIALGPDDGLDLIKQISQRWPQVRMLVLSMHGQGLYGERSLRAGAHGYVEKGAAAEELLAAVRAVLAGRLHLETERPGLHESSGSEEDAEVASLSDRELTVFRLLGEGRSVRDIAERLRVSVKTVQTYRDRVRAKLGHENARALTHHATLWVARQRSGGA